MGGPHQQLRTCKCHNILLLLYGLPAITLIVMANMKFILGTSTVTSDVFMSTTQPIQLKVPPKLNSTKSWCILEKKYLPKNPGEHFRHFPHALEALLPCYSHFIETDSIIVASEEHYTIQKYIAQLLSAFGCDVDYFRASGTINKNDRGTMSIPGTDISFRINMYLMQPRWMHIIYLNKPEYAHYLRRKFVPDSVVKAIKGIGKPLQVGLLNRPKDRRVTNLGTEVLHSFRNTFPEMNVTYTEFTWSERASAAEIMRQGDRTLDGHVTDQALWFATKDVIIGPHGAQMANSLFITPGTIVLQMYPTGYFMTSIEPLIEQVGGIALQWYEKGITPDYEYRKDEVPGEEVHSRDNFRVPPIDIVKQIQFALNLVQPDADGMAAVFGSH